MSTLYLNNTGSRWVSYQVEWDDKTQTGRTNYNKKVKIKLQTVSGKVVERTVIFWEAFGNFAVACISYKGKKIKVFADTVLED